MLSYFKDHWEQAFFGLVGLAFLIFSFNRLWNEDVAGASATFAMAFFSFLYSNITRFKRFKGLGFEAELWDDKQKEAEQLIDRLKAVVTVYTREVVLQKVMQGRWSDGAKWEENWALYEELVAKHNELGQAIDFSDLKTRLDKVFLFDIVANLYGPIRGRLADAYNEAQKKITNEFGSPIKDVGGYSVRLSQLRDIPVELKDLYGMSLKGDVAWEVIEFAKVAQAKFRDNFGIEVELPSDCVVRLEEVSSLCKKGPIKVSDDLIELANHR